MDDLPKIGTILQIIIPSGRSRRGKIVAYYDNNEMVLIDWVDYNIPNEEIPTRWLS